MDSLIALVPARGGSKGVPRKNLRLINGKSLTELAILRAQKTGLFSEVWVSTDDDEIESQSLAMGARVLRRSGRTGSDSATANEVVEEFISSLNLEKSVSICYLQPTSPLLRSRTVQSAVSIHQESGKRPVVGIRRVTEPAGKHVFLEIMKRFLKRRTYPKFQKIVRTCLRHLSQLVGFTYFRSRIF